MGILLFRKRTPNAHVRMLARALSVSNQIHSQSLDSVQIANLGGVLGSGTTCLVFGIFTFVDDTPERRLVG